MEKQLKKRLKLKWTTFIIMHFVYETSAFVLEHTKWRPGSFTKLDNERWLETSMVLTRIPEEGGEGTLKVALQVPSRNLIHFVF